jgi:hypothetical protein
MEVFLIVGQTYTTVIGGHLMNADLGCMIQDETIAGRANPLTEQACLLEPVANFFRAVLYSLATVFQHAIDLRSDLADQNLVLSVMAKSKRGADGERSQVIEAFSELLLGIRGEQ